MAVLLSSCSKAPDQTAVTGSTPTADAAPAKADFPLSQKPQTVTLGEGTPIKVRTQTSLSTKSTKTGDTFAATLAEPIVIDGKEGRIMLGADIQDHHAHRLIVQGIPRLLVEGKVPPLKPQIAERTAVCAGGNIVVLVVSTKVEATAFAHFLADPPDQGGLGCRDALNLDGGPSTQLVVKLPGLALSLPGGWGVPNALVVAPRKQ